MAIGSYFARSRSYYCDDNKKARVLSGFNNAAGDVCVVFLNEVSDATALSFDMSSKACVVR